MEKFSEFISEQKDIEKYRALIISTEHGSKAITAERMEEEAKKLGIETYVVKMNGTYIQFDNGIHTIHKEDDDSRYFDSRCYEPIAIQTIAVLTVAVLSSWLF